MRALKLIPVVALLLFCPLFAAVELVAELVPFLLLVLVGGVVAVGWSTLVKSRRRNAAAAYIPLATMSIDVAAVRLAIAASARETIQARLADLARTGATRTKADLLALLRETIAALIAADHAWRFTTVTSTTPRPKPVAEGLFRAVAQEARARFTDEVIRNVDGHVATGKPFTTLDDAPTTDALVVVTLVVAARREIPDLPGHPRASAVRDLLRDLAALEEKDLVAFEVVWSPADAHEHVGEDAIRRRYPELVPLRGVGLDGRIHCSYRCPPYDPTLSQCPTCGAPREV